MKPLYIEPSDVTPEIDFNTQNNNFSIRGISRPENVTDFFQPVMDWLKELVEKFKKNESTPFSVSIEMVYFNSSSAKYLMLILSMFKKLSEKGASLHIKWNYQNGDEQMKLDGEDLSEAIEIPFMFNPQ